MSLEFHHWLPTRNVWAADVSATLIAVAGSIYAAVRASRWWYALTVAEALMVLVLVLALGG
jgi:hypothetical protein